MGLGRGGVDEPSEDDDRVVDDVFLHRRGGGRLEPAKERVGDRAGGEHIEDEGGGDRERRGSTSVSPEPPASSNHRAEDEEERPGERRGQKVGDFESAKNMARARYAVRTKPGPRPSLAAGDAGFPHAPGLAYALATLDAKERPFAPRLTMATCPTCRTHYPDDALRCAADGEHLLPDEAFRGGRRRSPRRPVVGEYRIEAQLGEGGFGAVYRAVHPLIGKAAAIKVLHRQFSSNPQMVSRFIAEARAVNQIRHSNIIDIFSFGAPRGRPAVLRHGAARRDDPRRVLEDEGAPPPEQAIPILRGIARALDAAHAQRHRPPRPQAREHLPRVRRRRRRPRPSCSTSASPSSSASRRRRPQDAHRHADGHAQLHVARAVPRAATSTTARTSTRSASCVHEVLTGQRPSTARR